MSSSYPKDVEPKTPYPPTKTPKDDALPSKDPPLVAIIDRIAFAKGDEEVRGASPITIEF